MTIAQDKIEFDQVIGKGCGIHLVQDGQAHGEDRARVEELDTNKIQMVLRIFFTAIYRGLHVDYVLVDSWFTCDALVQAIRSVKNQTVHLIGMYKFAMTRFE